MKRPAYSFIVLSIIFLFIAACTPQATPTQAPVVVQASPVPATETPTVAPSPTFTPAPLFIVINIDFAYLRSGPDVDYPTVSDAYIRGTKMEVLSKYKDWFYVKAPDQKIGWLYLQWIDLGGIDTTIIPTPSFLPDPPVRPTAKPTDAPYPNP